MKSGRRHEVQYVCTEERPVQAAPVVRVKQAKYWIWAVTTHQHALHLFDSSSSASQRIRAMRFARRRGAAFKAYNPLFL